MCHCWFHRVMLISMRSFKWVFYLLEVGVSMGFDVSIGILKIELTVTFITLTIFSNCLFSIHFESVGVELRRKKMQDNWYSEHCRFRVTVPLIRFERNDILNPPSCRKRVFFFYCLNAFRDPAYLHVHSHCPLLMAIIWTLWVLDIRNLFHYGAIVVNNCMITIDSIQDFFFPVPGCLLS